MSGTTTMSGGSVPAQFTGASGATAAFNSYFNSTTTFTVFSGSGVSTATGPVVVGTPNSAVTVSSATAVVDTTAGGNSITTTTPTTVFPAGSDTVNSTAAVTLYGGASGVTQFTASGTGSSVTGGSGGIIGTVSGENSTLVGGTGNSIYTLTAKATNTLAVAGPSGVTGINETATTGPELIATNPLGNSGTMVATLGSGADSVIGGGGASTITAGTGSDVFAFVKGHAGGSEVIIGYTASDNLAFAGYGYTATNLPTEAVGPVGDVITLSDGTTITLAGIDHKVF